MCFPNFQKVNYKNYQTTFSKYALLIEEFIVGGSKKMLEANSLLIKSENQNNSNQ